MTTGDNTEHIIMTACASHCGGGCLLKVYVRDGAVRRIETDGGAEPQLRACLRCRAYRQRLYDPDRIKHPLKRVGKRGEGKFERIGWDEALDTIAAQVNRVRQRHGPESLLFLGGGGDTMLVHRHALISDLLIRTGGVTLQWGFQSFEGALFASQASYGTLAVIGDAWGLMDSKLIILWGIDPAVTVQNTNTAWYIARARERGARIVSVDPRHTDSAAAFAESWLPVRPGTDTAVMLALAHVMITENLYDASFMARYTVGFDEFTDYVLGKSDGLPKTPGWAAGISGLGADRITWLARLYADSKPAALIGGIAPGRTAYGEQFHRAVHALAAMTGNIGVRGGWAGRLHDGGKFFGGFDYKTRPFPSPQPNPVEQGKGVRPDSLPVVFGSDSSARIHVAEMADAILQGKAGGFPADIHAMLVFQTNPVNQFANTKKLAQALDQLDFIAVGEQVMSATARRADIVLPVSTFLERTDMKTGGSPPAYTYVNQCAAPQDEARSILDIRNGLAARLGVTDGIAGDEDAILETILDGSYVSNLAEVKQRGVYRVPQRSPQVAFQEQITDPENHPFPTPSGRIEIFSARLAGLQNDRLPPVPSYIETWEGPADPLCAKYPLQLVTTHFKRRAHSQFENVPWLRELQPQALTLNAADAAVRGIRDGDMVRVFNDRGEVIIPARVTQRMMPGVVDLPQGAWYQPDASGRDRGGCANALTRDMRSPGGAACFNTNLVEVSRIK